MDIKGIKKTYKHVKRYRQILNIFIKYGFGFVIQKLGLLQKLSEKNIIRRKVKDIDTLTLPQRLRLAIEEMGPTFIKLGQILSTRPDILPEDYINELVKLQDSVKEFDGDLAKQQFETSTGKNINDVFSYFSQKPIASASIAQVHMARLLTGKEVVVKVQRPDIEKIIDIDLEILFEFARFLDSKVEEIRSYNLVGIIEEFSDAIKKELDFTKEAWNIDRFRRDFEGEDYIYIPTIYWEYITKKILVMEYIKGPKINELESLGDLQKKEICKKIATAFMKQVFENGFFHADPHPGNIFVNDKLDIVYIDFGMMGRLNKKLMSQIAELLIGVIEIDEDRIAEAFLDIGIISEEISINQFKIDIFELIQNYHSKTLNQIDIVRFLNDVFKIAISYKIVMPQEFTLLVKTIVTIEAICSNLDSDFNFVEFAKPFVNKLIRQRISIKSILRENIFKFKDTNKHLMVLPSMFNEFLKKANSGKLKVDFHHKGLEDLTSELNIMVNKLVLSIIIAALLVGSALLIQVNKGPFLYGFPIIGIIGFSSAFLLGLWLVFTIIKSGKM